MKNRATTIIRNGVYVIILLGIVTSLIFYIYPLNTTGLKQDGEKIIYFADNITPAHEKIIELFNKENAGRIKVVAVNLDHHKLNTNKRKALITRNLRNQRSKIDIFAIDYIWLPRFVKWAQSLKPYFIQTNNIIPELLPACYQGDSLYAVPFFYDIGILFYRQDILSRFKDARAWQNILDKGITWADVKRLKRVHFRDKPFYVIQAKAYEGLICNYIEMGAGKNINLFRDNSFVFDTKSVIGLNGFLFNLFHKDKIIPLQTLQFDENSAFNYALKNDSFFLRSWVTNVCNLNFPDSLKSKLHFLEVAALPKAKDGKFKPVLGGWNLIISKFSRNKKEAAEFLKFVISEKAQMELYKIGCNIPVLKNIDLSIKSRNKYLAKIIKENWIGQSIHRPPHVDYTRMSDTYSRLLNQMLEDKLSIEEGLTLAQQAKNDL